MPGRSGRGRCIRDARPLPKYLSTPPKRSPYTWNCSNNPYAPLEEPQLPPCIPKLSGNFFAHSSNNFPSNPTSPTAHSTDSASTATLTDDDIENYLKDNINMLFTSMSNLTTPQRPTSNSNFPKTISPNSQYSPNSQHSPQSPHKTSSFTESCHSVCKSSLSPQMTTPPTTPPKPMDIDTAPTSTKRKSSKTFSPSDSPKKSRKATAKSPETINISTDPDYDPSFTINNILALSEDAIIKTDKNHLAQILVRHVKADNKLSQFKRLLKLTETQIRDRALRVRKTLSKKPLTKITSATRDMTIKSLSLEALRATYKNIHKSGPTSTDLGALSLLSANELIKKIIFYRDSLTTTENVTDSAVAEVPATSTPTQSSHEHVLNDGDASSPADTDCDNKSKPPFDNASASMPSETSQESSTQTMDTDPTDDAQKDEPMPSPQSKTSASNPETHPDPNQIPSAMETDESSPTRDPTDEKSSCPTDEMEHSENASPTASRTGFRAPTDPPTGQNLEELLNDAADTSSSSSAVKEVLMHTLSIRPKIFGDRIEGTFSEIARTFFQKIREWDPSACIKPFDSPAQDFLYHESNIPDDLESASKWISNTVSTEKWKYFAFQIRTTKTLNYTRGKIIQWMSEVKCFTKVDKIRSDKITCLGFLDNFHPEFHNRDRIMCHIHEYLTEALQKETFVSVFTRPIHAGKGLDRTETDAVVIEAASDEASIISDHLYNITFDMYTDVMFVPFTKTDKSYETTLKMVLESNSIFTHEVEELNIPNLKFFNVGATYTSTIDNMRDILLSFNTTDCPFVHDVDVNRNGGTSVIYQVEYAKKARDFLLAIPDLLASHMSSDSIEKCLKGDLDIEKILKPTKAKLARSTLRHSRNVTKKYAKINPPEDNDDVPTSHSQQSYAAAVTNSKQLNTMEHSNSLITNKPPLVLNDDIRTYIDKAVQSKLQDYIPDLVTKEQVEVLINTSVEEKTSHIAQSQVTPDSITAMVETSVKNKLTDFDDRIIALENIETSDSILSTIRTEISSDLKSYDNRLSTVEKTVGEHTEIANQRLGSLENTLKLQTESLNKLLAAMTASNNHIPAANSNCRVAANIF